MRTFSLGAGKDTIVFAATAAANGEDEITGFTAGASADVLDFTATGVKKGTPVIAGSGSLSDSSGIAVISVADKGGIKFASSVSSAGDVVLSKKGSYIIITDVDGDNKAGNIYLVTAGTDNATSSDDITITLLGTVMREGDSGDWNAANFA